MEDEIQCNEGTLSVERDAEDVLIIIETNNCLLNYRLDRKSAIILSRMLQKIVRNKDEKSGISIT